jgi:hypothetical protein
LIFSDGDVILTDDPSTPMTLGFMDEKRRKFIFIMLHEIFKPIIKKLHEEVEFTKLHLEEFENDYSVKPISRKQRMLLKIVEDNDYSQITISKKKNGGLLVIGEKSLDGVKLTAEDLLKVIDEQKFGNIEAHKRNGEVESLRLSDVYKI